MIFMPRQKKQRPDMSININNNKIERVKETVLLGVVLDENILNVTRKISKSMGIIYKSSFCLQTSSIMHPGITSWKRFTVSHARERNRGITFGELTRWMLTCNEAVYGAVITQE